MSGNRHHRAPEVIRSLKELLQMKRRDGPPPHKEVPLEKQPSFAVGVCCYEVLCGRKPLQSYPTECTSESFKKIDDNILLEMYGKIWRDTIMGLLTFDASKRLSLSQVMRKLGMVRWNTSSV